MLKQSPNSPKHREFTTLAALIHDAVRLAAARPVKRRVKARRGWAGEKTAMLNILRECFIANRTNQRKDLLL